MSEVFPACAGMIRLPALPALDGHGVPRLRGDDPPVVELLDIKLVCSPPARG